MDGLAHTKKQLLNLLCIVYMEVSKMAYYIVKTQEYKHVINYITGKKPRVCQNPFGTSMRNKSSFYLR